MEELELRMYFFVPYQLTGIQQGIQSGHSALKFALKYGRYNSDHIIWDFIEKYQTWVILNGGTTNNGISQSSKGSLNEIYDSINVFNVTAKSKIDVSKFYEPDLNDSLTAICFICDERVFNKKKYPDFFDYLISMGLNKDIQLKGFSVDELMETYSYYYELWFDLIGGHKNIFLRDLINGKKLA